MQLMRCAVVTLCVLVVGLVCVPSSQADVPSLPDGDRRAREAKLKKRATEWLKLKTRLGVTCPTCGGAGKTKQRGGRYPGQERTCSTCKGGKAILDARIYMRVFYNYYSPAFRAQDGIKDRLNAQWREYMPHGRRSVGGRDFIERFEIEDLHLVDATHGVVRVWLDKHKRNPRKPAELRWVWSSEKPGRTGHWYVYDTSADGRWPQAGALKPYGGARNMGATALKKANEGWPESALHRLTNLHKRDKDLIITIEANEGIGYRDLHSQLHAEALELFGRGFELSKRWERVILVAGALWRNGLGETDTKVYGVLEFTRAEWKRLKPENLSAHELLEAFDIEYISYDDWKHWE